jgi:hypothetical protein
MPNKHVIADDRRDSTTTAAPERPQAQQAKRRWFQFSLKALIGLMTICCIGIVATQQFLKPHLSVEPLTPHDHAVIHGSFVDFRRKPLGYGVVKVRAHDTIGGWTTHQSQSVRPKRDWLGRCPIDVHLEPPGGAWTPGTYYASVWLGGDLRAETKMVVLNGEDGT